MKLRLWLGVILIAIVGGLFSYRGTISGYMVEKFAKKGLPEAISEEELTTLRRQSAQKPQEVASEPSSGSVYLEGIQGSDSADAADLPAQAGAPNLSSPHRQDSALGEIKNVELPVEFNLAVPFTSQAPFAVWDEIHDDACEEASVIMVDAFFNGHSLYPQSVDDEIFQLVDWQTQNLGHWKDTNLEETARILQEVYGYKTVRIVENPTLEMIKREIFAGRPVIVPAAGRALHNPYFRGAGPPYHMLVVRGWTAYGKLITNDPGTKRGNAFLYASELLLNAIHDWTGSDETITQGRKAVIVVEK